MHIKFSNGQTEKCTIAQMRRDNPQAFFPSEITDDNLVEYSVYSLAATPMTVYDPLRRKSEILTSKPTKYSKDKIYVTTST